jgi:hypothetical protein
MRCRSVARSAALNWQERFSVPLPSFGIGQIQPLSCPTGRAPLPGLRCLWSPSFIAATVALGITRGLSPSNAWKPHHVSQGKHRRLHARMFCGCKRAYKFPTSSKLFTTAEICSLLREQIRPPPLIFTGVIPFSDLSTRRVKTPTTPQQLLCPTPAWSQFLPYRE